MTDLRPGLRPSGPALRSPFANRRVRPRPTAGGRAARHRPLLSWRPHSCPLLSVRQYAGRGLGQLVLLLCPGAIKLWGPLLRLNLFQPLQPPMHQPAWEQCKSLERKMGRGGSERKSVGIPLRALLLAQECGQHWVLGFHYHFQHIIQFTPIQSHMAICYH